MPSAPFVFRVLSPLGRVFEGEAWSATLPTPDGEITVLAHHMPLVALLADGELRVRTGSGEVSIAVAGGFLETGDNRATVLSDFAAVAEGIETARVEEARRRAERLLAEQGERGALALVERDLRLAILQLKVAEQWSKRKRA